MKYILIACLCCFVLGATALMIAIAIECLDGTDFMDAIAERIRGEK